MGPFAILALFPVSGALFLLFLLPSCHMVSCPGHSSSSQQLTGSSSWRVPLPTLLSPNTAAALGTGKVPPRTPSQPLSQAPGSIFGSDRVRNTPRLLTKTASLCSKTDRAHTDATSLPGGEREPPKLVQQSPAALAYLHSITAWIRVTRGTQGHPSSPPLGVSIGTAMPAAAAWFHFWSCTTVR